MKKSSDCEQSYECEKRVLMAREESDAPDEALDCEKSYKCEKRAIVNRERAGWKLLKELRVWKES